MAAPSGSPAVLHLHRYIWGRKTARPSVHFIATLARLLGPGGVRSVVAESLLLKHQLLIVNRSRQRTPNLRSSDRILAGLLALLVRRTRLLRPAIVLNPSTLLAIHKEPSHPYLNERANAESACVTTNRKSPFVSMATALSILISDTSGRVIFRRLSIALVSGQPWEDFQLIKSFGACILGCCALRESDRFTPTVSIRQRQAAKARLCCVRFVSRYFSCSINILRLTANNSGASFRRLSKEAADGFL